jgi:CheY-like chemotaxis protein
VDADLPKLCGDADRLQQVVWNLLTNAVKFTPSGGTVSVAARRRNESIEIVVADSGQGIDAAFLPHVFERFRQEDATPSRRHGGLGLGLSIVRHLVELHGGMVRAESEGTGRGATFTAILPIASLDTRPLASAPALRTTSAELEGFAELAGVSVLVVDDEEDARDVLHEMLMMCGAKVTAASSARDALQLVEDVRPDLIVSDVSMPDEDGYSFVRRLRALPRTRGGLTPAVALTAYTRLEDRTKALLAGFNMHVPKPVDPRQLLAVLVSLSTMFERAH